MIRRTTRALAALALTVVTGLAPVVVPSASPVAAADPVCTVTANLPARIAVDRPDKLVPVRLTGCEGYLNYAAASLYGPAGTIDFLFWDGVRVEYATVYDYEIRPGVYSTADGNGYATDRTLQWRYTSTTIKFATGAGVAASRVAGGRTTVTVLAKRYSADSNSLIAYGNRVVGVQTATSAAGPWTTVGYVKVGASARASLTVAAPAGRYYRSFFGDTGSFFGAVSPAVRA